MLSICDISRHSTVHRVVTGAGPSWSINITNQPLGQALPTSYTTSCDSNTTILSITTPNFSCAAWHADAVLRCAFCPSVRPPVCLSVRLSNVCIVTKRKKAMFRFLYHIKNIYPSFLRRRMVGCWATTSTWNFGLTGPRWSEIADFEPIIARSASVVQPSEKSSINTNRKSLTRFPTSLRWSSYVAPKSPKGGLKKAKRPFSIYNRNSLEESLLQSFFVWKLVSGKVVGHSLA